jgi:ubiquinone/menaquinone biosynthesis C-methylase UbiE
MSLPTKDYTPIDFKIEQKTFLENIKDMVRKYFNPLYLKTKEKKLESQFRLKEKLSFDRIFLGQKGNDYIFHRKNLNQYKKINNKIILIVGCGHGQDIESWVKYKPRKIIAIDYLNYSSAWNKRKKYFKSKYNINVEFYQADAKSLDMINDNSVDFVCSDAVYEHLQNYEKVICELVRVLKKNGIMYASFGPLWCSFGGDILSGSDNVKNGFNHILLSKIDYQKYFENTFDKNDRRRFYFENDMFSYLKADEYMSIIEGYNLECLYKSCIISKRTLQFKDKYPELYNKLLKNYKEEDLLMESLSFIYEKK